MSESNGIQLFRFEGRKVRTAVIDYVLWWVLSDVAKILGYRDANHASRVLNEHQSRTHRMGTSAGTRTVTMVNVGGLNQLVMRSNKPEAKQFQAWVTDEVLPSIQKTGAYSAPAAAASGGTASEALYHHAVALAEMAKNLCVVEQRQEATIADVDELRAELAELRAEKRDGGGGGITFSFGSPRYGIGEFFKMHGMHIDRKEAARLGRLARKHCIQCGIGFTRNAKGNSYPDDVMRIMFGVPESGVQVSYSTN